MKKIIHIVFLSILLFPVSEKLKAQSETTGWQLSLGWGFMNYYGDVSPYRIQKWSDWQDVFKFFQYNQYYVPKASFGISLEKRFTPGVGMMLQANEGTFAMSDRYRYGNGEYDYNAPHWDRALNFETHVWDAGLALAFHTDNGKFLYSNSFLAPYFFIGGGLTYFQVYGDLYDSSGKPYNYADQNVHPNGPYNTNLRPLMVETNKEFPDVVPYADLGIGIKFRFSKVVSLTIQSDIKYSFSDYLDDVSRKYKVNYATPEQALAAHPGTNVIAPDRSRGYNDGVNDFYIFNKASLQFSFGSHPSRRHFNAPIVYNPGLIHSAEMINQAQTLSQAEKDSLENIHEQDSLNAIQQQDSLKQIMAKHIASDSVLNMLKQLQAEMLSLRFAHIDQDYLIRQNKTQYRIQLLENNKRSLESKSSLTKADKEQMQLDQIKIDSLQIQWHAIQKAREQLRNDMAHTPIITEYADSTKIMIYKGQESPSGNYLPLIGSQEVSTDTAAYPSRGINNNQVPVQSQNELDSVQRIQDSLLNNYQNDTSHLHQQVFNQMQYESNLSNIRNDSIHKMQLQQSIDSLQNIQDSIIQQTTNRNFLQRFFDKFEKNKQAENESQDIITRQQRLINNNKAEIDRLNDEIRTFRRNNQQYNPGISREERRNERLERTYLENAIANLNRDRRRQNRIEIVPRIEPALVTSGKSDNNQQYEKQLKAIRKKLDSIQVQQANIQGRQNNPDSIETNQIVNSLHHQIDSLKDLQAKEQLISMNNQIIMLNQQVDSLHRQIANVQNEQTATAKENANNFIAHFPVISAYFTTGSSALSDAQINKLRPAATMAKNNPDVIILLTGFTDGTGSVRINQIIAGKRCRSVKNIFVHKFNIDPSRIQVDSIGETGTGHGSNPLTRRVDVRLERKKGQ